MRRPVALNPALQLTVRLGLRGRDRGRGGAPPRGAPLAPAAAQALADSQAPPLVALRGAPSRWEYVCIGKHQGRTGAPSIRFKLGIYLQNHMYVYIHIHMERSVHVDSSISILDRNMNIQWGGAPWSLYHCHGRSQRQKGPCALWPSEPHTAVAHTRCRCRPLPKIMHQDVRPRFDTAPR